MDLRTRVTILSESADRDWAGGAPSRRSDAPLGTDEVAARPGDPVGITSVRRPGHGVTRLMRVMQTNACSLSCGYCPTFCGGRIRRTYLDPEEVTRVFIDAHRRGLADGLFLTSGVPGRPSRMTDRMLATLELLRRREGFRGYVHLKLLPGAERGQVEAASRLASRLSVNLEAPGDAYVRALAPEKNFAGDLLPNLELAGRLALAKRREGPADLAGVGPTTQFVVGAAGERDREILGLVARLERQRLLHHAHFSAFQPVVGTPLEARRPAPAARELRLYQAEHLLRQYGFEYDELVFAPDGNLPLEDDPKTAWAIAHPERFPIDVARAPYEALVRVPGIGPATARAFVAARHGSVIRWSGDLRAAGVDVSRAGWFLTLHGRRLADAPRPRQLRLFPPGEHLTQAPFRTPVPPCAYR
jgi:predicted DNA-binding helix-hairpin-helix protein